MSAQRERGSKQHEEEDAQDVQDVSVSEQTERQKSAETSPTVVGDLLDEIDRVLKEQCGYKADEIVDPKEFEARAGVVTSQYIQKPGQ